MNSKNIILTRSLANEKLLLESTSPSIQAYASKIGADFAVIASNPIPSTPNEWAKLQIATFLEDYDRVLYIDPDCIVRDDTPDLFALVPEAALGILDETPLGKRDMSLVAAACTMLGKPANPTAYYNSGVMLFSKQHADLLKRPGDPMLGFRFDDHLSALIASHNVQIHDIGYRFNRLPQFDQVTGEERFESYIIHYIGYPETASILPLIRHDLDVWERSNGVYRYQRHYLISAVGGVGDHATAEPAIRAFIKAHPIDDVRIAAHWPEMYAHLPVPSSKHNEFVFQGQGYKTVHTLPGKESAIWRAVCFLLCHMVDYHTMAMLLRMLPHGEREIQLPVKDEDATEMRILVGDMRRAVVVHAGKSWKTKTFPKEWWQEVVNTLSEKDFKVVLIGKSRSDIAEDKTGIVDIECPANGVDLRDKLPLPKLLALLESAPLLLTNDSSPVQLAGAFDNWIVMLATIKHPDLVFPYRKGSTAYKTKALYRKLMIDEIPFDAEKPESLQIDFEVPDWSPYLPEPKEVAAEIGALFDLRRSWKTLWRT